MVNKNDHSKESFIVMDSMRKKKLFCDVTLISKNVEIQAHKVILASCSEFFYKAFIKMGQNNRLKLEDIDPEALLLLINFIYTSQIEITLTNVQNVLIGANILELKTIKNICCKLLEKHLHPETALLILSIARIQDCKELFKKSEDFIDKNFNTISVSDEFLKMSFEQLTDLIGRDSIVVSSEEKIYESVLFWLKHDLESRTQHISVLMSQVRLNLLSKEYLANNVINEPILKADLKCKDLIIEALICENLPGTIKTIKSTPKPRGNTSEVLLIMGGYSLEAEGTFEYYDIKKQSWSKLFMMPLRKRGTHCVLVNNKVYVIGRCDVTRPINVITEFDFVTNSWLDSIAMITSRTYYGIGVLNNFVYAVGGCNSEGRLNSAEKFDVKAKKWVSIATMSNRRSCVSIGVFNEFLCAIGGFGEHNLPIKSVEYYDSKIDVWKKGCELIYPRGGASVVVLDNRMFVIGGFDGKKCINSVEYFSSDEDKFVKAADLNVARRNCGVATINGLIYVIGGSDGDKDLSSVEVYAPKDDKWILLETSMNIPRSCHGVIVVDKIF
ncbi:ring canal kelch homolog [Onthophagus taurus]|uniref:ring canal kelch homolog n=1 Tax=Onthophagus taurus TaxID=166361 RepID=UPI0039BDC3F5